MEQQTPEEFYSKYEKKYFDSFMEYTEKALLKVVESC
jgi:hypothetical protein